MTGITGENMVETPRVTESEGHYSGVTPDERLAMSHIFDREEGILMAPEQFSDVFMTSKPLQYGPQK